MASAGVDVLTSSTMVKNCAHIIAGIGDAQRLSQLHVQRWAIVAVADLVRMVGS
jgi:hypothetical protein